MRIPIRLCLIFTAVISIMWGAPLAAQVPGRMPFRHPFRAQTLGPGFPAFAFMGSSVNFVGGLPTGTYVHAVRGTMTPATGLFVPSDTGTALLRGRGVFMPTGGTFLPSNTGNFVLRTPATFDPNTGKLVPSPTGQFAMATRGTLASTSTGKGVTSFVPLQPQLPVNFPINPYAALPVSNPYQPSVTIAAPYPAPSYGAGSYGSMPYPMGSGNNYTPMAAPVAYPQAPVERAHAPTAYGLPLEDRRLRLPLALRLLPPEAKRNLTDRLEGQLDTIAAAAPGGMPQPAVVAQARRSVQELRGWLQRRRDDMAEATYDDGMEFLRSLDATLAGLSY